MAENQWTRSTQLAELQGGATPFWRSSLDDSDPLTYTGPPDTVDAGLALNNDGALYAAKTQVDLQLRTVAHHRTAVITVVAANARTYTVSIDGTPYDYLSDGSATAAEILAGLAALINADTLADAVVNDAQTAMTVTGATQEDYSLGVDVSAVGTIAAVADNVSATAFIWWYSKPNGPDSDAVIPGRWCWSQDEIVLTWRGFTQRYDSAGKARMYVQLEDVAGHPSDAFGAQGAITYNTPLVAIGPCLLDEGA